MNSGPYNLQTDFMILKAYTYDYIGKQNLKNVNQVQI